MLTNLQFGRLRVLEQDKSILSNKENSYNTFWKCRCQCGKIVTVKRNSLMTGNTKSCGCLQKEKVIENGLASRFKKNHVYLDAQEAILRQLYREYFYRSKIKERQFLLSLREFKALIQQNCYYCNESPKQKKCLANKEEHFLLYNGLDRLDSQEGYVKGNVVSCCVKCNIAKASMSQRDFFNWISKIHACLQSKNLV